MISLFLAFTCSTVTWTFTNRTIREPALDDANAAVADKGCKRYYGPDACLTRMIKYSARDYRAICRTRQP